MSCGHPDTVVVTDDALHENLSKESELVGTCTAAYPTSNDKDKIVGQQLRIDYAQAISCARVSVC